MTTSDKLREFGQKVMREYGRWWGVEAKDADKFVSDLTALISEGYYPKEFTRWFRSEKFYDIFEESTDGEDNTQWEYLPSGQILNTTDELFNYWKENEQC